MSTAASSSARSSRSRSRRRWNAPSSTTPCRSSCQRALPDVRDGLKPVHRRILWDMETQGFRPDRPFVKCARRHRRHDGEVPPAQRAGHLRRPRAHGPAVLAPPPAHRLPRQLRLARLRCCGRALHRVPIVAIGHALLRRTSTRTPSTSSRTTTAPRRADRAAGPLPQPARQRQPGHRRGHGHQHPAAQPGRGDRRHRSTSSTTRMPPPTTSWQFVKGPDFPTGGLILGRAGIIDAYRTGRGSVKMRAKAEIEEAGKRGDRFQIVVTELPYQVSGHDAVAGPHQRARSTAASSTASPTSTTRRPTEDRHPPGHRR